MNKIHRDTIGKFDTNIIEYQDKANLIGFVLVDQRRRGNLNERFRYSKH